MAKARRLVVVLGGRIGSSRGCESQRYEILGEHSQVLNDSGRGTNLSENVVEYAGAQSSVLVETFTV